MNEDMFPEGATITRAQCMYCGSKFETPAEIRLHTGACKPRFWFWLIHNKPVSLAWWALGIGFVIGRLWPW